MDGGWGWGMSRNALFDKCQGGANGPMYQQILSATARNALKKHYSTVLPLVRPPFAPINQVPCSSTDEHNVHGGQQGGCCGVT